MSDLDNIQRSARAQFDRQSDCYGKGHILADVTDVETALRRLPPTSGRRALDVATGAGHTGLCLAGHGWQVTLADISAPMLAKAAAAARERGLVVETRQHPAEELPYADASFDLVTCRVAPHHFSSPERFVRETARVLRTSGAFLLIDGSIEDGQPEAEAWLHHVEKLRDPSHNRFLARGEWTRLCEAAGLEVIVAELQPLKQPDLNWYLDVAGTPPEARATVFELARSAPASARKLFRLAEEAGKIVWWWQRLTLIASKR